MATLDRYVREDIAHAYCFRVTDPQLRQHFVNIVNDLYGVAQKGPRGRTVASRTSENRARMTEPRFPGAVPCSIMREDLDLLRKEHYVAFEKTNGTRYLMLCTSLPGAADRSSSPTNFCVLINRRWEARVVRVDFQRDVYERDTLFDGELVQNNETGRWVFLIFDLVSSGHVSTSRDNYISRMKAAHHIVRNSLRQDRTSDAFDISVKRYEKMEQFDRLYGADKHYRGFPTDGYVFMPVRRYVAPFRNRQILKWKDTSNSTIDLQLRFSANNGLEYWMKDTRDDPKFFAPVTIDFTISKTHTELIQKYAERLPTLRNYPIVECAFDQKRHLWFMVCERTDKQSPNAEYTVQRTLENVRENITKDELFYIIANERVGYEPNHRRNDQQQQQTLFGPQTNIDNPFLDSDSSVDHVSSHKYPNSNTYDTYANNNNNDAHYSVQQYQKYQRPVQQPPIRQIRHDRDGQYGYSDRRQAPLEQRSRRDTNFVHQDRMAILGSLATVASKPKKKSFVAEHNCNSPYYENTSFQTPKPIAEPPDANLSSPTQLRTSTSSEMFEYGEKKDAYNSKKQQEQGERQKIDESSLSLFASRQKRKLDDTMEHDGVVQEDKQDVMDKKDSCCNSRAPRTCSDSVTDTHTSLPVPFHPYLVEEEATYDDAPPPSHFLPPPPPLSSSALLPCSRSGSTFNDEPSNVLSNVSLSVLTSSASPNNRQQQQQQQQQRSKVSVTPNGGFVPVLVDDIVEKSEQKEDSEPVNIQDMLAQLSNVLQSEPDSALAAALKKV